SLNSSSAIGSGSLHIAAGATFDDQTAASGLLIRTTNFGVSDNGSDAVVVNDGTFRKTGTAATSSIDVEVVNNGDISVEQGTLVLAKVSGSGTLNVSGAGHLVLNGDFNSVATNDVLIGSNGFDTLNGLSGDDRLIGLGGNDFLSGGAGTDVFVFAPGFGNDRITDFAVSGVSHDIIEVSTAMFADWTALESAIVDTAEGAMITYNTDSVVIENVSMAQLVAYHVDDFHFI
ncbi:MAG: hypothetical protein KDJ45_11435, partial [Hyphomicrobiaceae bacterium]|nr:hypothetical protein [Hyphomicrobiaceae bacterium]